MTTTTSVQLVYITLKAANLLPLVLLLFVVIVVVVLVRVNN